MKRLWRFSITRGIIGGFLLVLIPIVVLNLLINYISITVVRNEVMNSYTNAIDLLAEQLESNLNKFEAMANVLTVDSEINRINYARDVTDELIWDYTRQLNLLEMLSTTNELDCLIHVYLQNRNKVLSSKGSIDNMDRDYNTQFLPKGSDQDMRWRFQSKRYAFVTEQYLSFTYYNNLQRKATDVVVCIDVNVRHVRAFLQNLKVYSGGTVYLLDDQGHILLSSDSNDIDLSALRTMNAAQGMSRDITYSQDNEKYWIFTNQSSQNGLTLGICFPEEQIMEPIFNIQRWIAAFIITSVVLAVLFTLYSYNSFLSPIRRLIDAMRLVRKGDLKVRVFHKTNEDLGFMITQFNSMVEQIDLLINEVYAEKLKVQAVNLIFLQSQIKPHFLYNCLYSVYHMINVEDYESASNMSLYLGKYFRFATRSSMDFVSVGEELDNLDTYICIHKMRFPRKIDHVIDVEQAIRKMIIPRLIIQPLVENAIAHGMEGIDRAGNIWIHGYEDDREVVITIEDDGKGMTDEKLMEIQSKMNELNQDGDMYGLCNTNMRLKLKYGEQAGIYLEQRASGGVKATVRIPRIRSEHDV